MTTAGGLVAHVLGFARLLRNVGLRVGSAQVALALRALERVDVGEPADVYWSLHALWVSDPRERVLFEQAFRLFWQAERGPDQLLQQLLTTPEAERRRERALRRVTEALLAQAPPAPERDVPPREPPPLEWDAALSHSERERLSSKDFEQMSADEVRRAKEIIARWVPSLPPLPSRRLRPAVRGERIDFSATLRASARMLGDSFPLRFRTRSERPVPLVVLCDISGSMERYSRIFLHFMHALTGHRPRSSVHCFVFGTRLTSISRALRTREVDLALAQIGASVSGWTGGTRIGASLLEFNQRWLRRIPLRRATVLLISDGLDRDGGAHIGPALERLRRSSGRIVWLNPLLRYAGFQPRAAGVRAILSVVDEHLPVHNLQSLEALSEVLSGVPPRAQRSR